MADLTERSAIRAEAFAEARVAIERRRLVRRRRWWRQHRWPADVEARWSQGMWDAAGVVARLERAERNTR